MTRRRLRVDADHDAEPLWELGGMGHLNLSPDTLPLSDELKAALRAWAREYEPWVFTPPSAPERKAWHHRGQQLAERVQTELGDEFAVQYGLPRRS